MFGIVTAGQNKIKTMAADFLIAPVLCGHFFSHFDLLGGFLIVLRCQQTQLIESAGRKGLILIQNQHHLIKMLWPGPVKHFIAVGDDMTDHIAVRACHQLGKILGPSRSAHHH